MVTNGGPQSHLQKAPLLSKHWGAPQRSHFHLHLLRHAFASKLLASGVDVVTISDILGHGASMTTLLYSHSSPAQKRKAVDTLSGH
jgi:site-specific recombinase XerD